MLQCLESTFGLFLCYLQRKLLNCKDFISCTKALYLSFWIRKLCFLVWHRDILAFRFYLRKLVKNDDRDILNEGVLLGILIYGFQLRYHRRCSNFYFMRPDFKEKEITANKSGPVKNFMSWICSFKFNSHFISLFLQSIREI